MKLRLLSLLTVIFFCAQLRAQSFYGVVKKADSTSTPIFQAQVEVNEGDKPFNNYKTYFDGGYKFNVNKNQTYTVKISYSGYKDTTFAIQTDKAGKPFPEYVVARLKKDGMRLMGILKSREENFPIKNAVVILKNVMTKKEDRITTGIDGAYNFKLEYETNYKVSVDKRSVGIFNVFKDTSFYVSTIGFNQPLDYKLDIALDPVLYIAPTSRDHYEYKPVSEMSKTEIASIAETKQPFIQDEKKQEWGGTVSQLQSELEQTKKELEALKKKEEERKKGSGGISFGAATKKKGKENPNLEVVVIRDEPVKKISSEAQVSNEMENKKLQADSEKKLQQIDAEIERQKKEEQMKDATQAKKKAQDLAEQQQAFEDSIEHLKQEEDARLMSMAVQKQKERVDSIAAEQARQNDIVRAKAEQEHKDKEVAAKKTGGDSVKNDLRTLFVPDSALRIKEEIAKKAAQDSAKKILVEQHAKIVLDSINKVREEQQQQAKILAAEKATEDSIKNAVHVFFVRVQDSIKRAKETAAKKAVLDSISKVRTEQQRKANELAAKKMTGDSLKKITRGLFVHDSIMKAKETWAKKHEQDSIKKVLAEAKAKQIQDSVAQVKTEQQRKARELFAKKLAEDSIKKNARALFVQDSVVKAQERLAKKHEQDSVRKALAGEKAKQIQDSITQVRVEQQRKAKELVAKKAVEDSLKKIARGLFVQDSIVKAQERLAKKHEQDSVRKALAADKVKQIQDSITQVRVEQQRKAKELVAKKAVEDSLKKIVRGLFVQDSIVKVQERLAKKHEQDSVRKVLVEAKAKQIQDSISQVKAERQQRWKEMAAKKATEDSLKYVAHALFINDSIAEAKAWLEYKAKELAEKKAIATARAQYVIDSVTRTKAAALAREKVKADSIARVKAEQARIAKELAAKKLIEDSLHKLAIAARTKFVVDSTSKVKAEVAAKQKAEQEASAKLKAEREQQARELALKMQKEELSAKAKEDSLRREKVLAEKKLLADSIAKMNAAIAQHNTEIQAARKKIMEDSLARVQLERDLKQQEAKLAAEQKTREEAMLKASTENEATRRLEEEELQRSKKALDDSVVIMRTDQEKMEREVAAAKQKANEETAKRVEAEATAQKQKAAEESKAIAEKQSAELKAKEIQLIHGRKDSNSAILNNIISPELPAIEFEKNAVEITADMKTELKKAIIEIQNHPERHINIYAIASIDEANPKQISLRRSDMVLRYLIDNGVGIEKISSFYYGSAISRNGCVSQNCPENILKQNRSVVYQLIKPN